MLRNPSVDGVERGGDHVHAQHHPGAAPVRLVVHLAGGQRGRVAVVEDAEVELRAENGRDRTSPPEPLEGVRNEREDVEAHDDEP